MSALPADDRDLAGSGPAAEWAQIVAAAPQLAATMRRYLGQLGTFLAPASVAAADSVLRQFARWLLATTSVTAVAAISRDDIEDFKVHLAARPGRAGRALSASTCRQRMQTLRMFFERIIEWHWPDAPARNPVTGGDIPPRPEPLPKFLHDKNAAALMAAARAAADPRDRLVMELLARTGMRAGELADLEAGAVVRIGTGHWLRIPPGKLRNDRYVPLHPQLVELLAPAELDRRMESACETCAYFRTGTQFLPILTRQRDHARDHGQAGRAALFDGLIQRAETERS